MHRVEQVRRRVGAAAPGIDDRAVREVSVDVARVHVAALANEVDQGLRARLARSAPCRPHGARMHERENRARNEAVIDDEILLDIEHGIAPVEIARAIAGDAVAQHQVLRTCRRTDRIGLHEPAVLDCLLQIDRREETARDRVAAKLGDADDGRHAAGREGGPVRC
jgi:hypothetical protein